MSIIVISVCKGLSLNRDYMTRWKALVYFEFWLKCHRHPKVHNENIRNVAKIG